MEVNPRAAGNDPFGLTALLWKQRRLIILITLLGLVGGAVASFLIKPRFKSNVVMFPVTFNTPSKALLNEGSGGNYDLMAFGDEESAQPLLQILHSDRLRERVAQAFDLYASYGIPADSPHRHAELYDAFNDRVRMDYTKYGSVQVTVEDENAQKAADMANMIADLVDTVWTEMTHDRLAQGYALVQRRVEEQEAIVAQLSDSIRMYGDHGLQNYNSQTERLTQSLGEAIVHGNKAAAQDLEGRFKDLARYSGGATMTNEAVVNEAWRLGVWRMRLAQVRADMESEMPHKFTMERAMAADKKSYPVRWLVTLMSGISGLFFALAVIIIRNNVQKLRAIHG